MSRRRSDLFEVVSDKVQAAALEMHEQLEQSGIPHALIGGLAVGAYARPRATRDVDFLVPASARAELAGKLVRGHLAGVTVNVQGVHVDLMFAEDDEAFLEDEIERSPEISGLPVLVPEALVYLKLAVGRRRDTNDIMDMIRAGLDPDVVRSFLMEHADHLLEDFDQLVEEAELGE